MRYICVPCVTPYNNDERCVDACYVTADTPEEAARLAAAEIQSEKPDGDEEYLAKVFVIEAEKYEILSREPIYVVANGTPTSMCCGGAGANVEMHSGYCLNDPHPDS